MVYFNELRITEDGRCLIVDCEIDSLTLHSGMYISSIYVEYYKNVNTATMPGESAYLLYHNESDDPLVREKRVEMTLVDLRSARFGIEDFRNGLFFVIVVCDGDIPEAAAHCDCSVDNTVDVGVALDWKKFYSLGMGYIGNALNNCAGNCDPNSGFEQFILQWNALKLAIYTCDWEMVINMWSKMLGDFPANYMFAASGCGCH